MRVLITSNLIYPHIGGIENSIHHLAREAVAHGDDVVIVASDAPAKGGARSGTSANGISIRLYRSFYGWPQPFRLVMSFCSALLLYRSIRVNWPPDVVIVRYHFNVVAAVAAGLRRIYYLVPGIVRTQNSAAHLRRSHSASGRVALWINGVLQRYALAASDRVFVFSQNMMTQTRALWSRAAVRIVAPGVDTGRFQMSERIPNVDDRVVLLCVGRLVAAKGVRYAVEALQHLPANFVLTIVGDGEDRSELGRLAVQLGVNVRVSFVGESVAPEEYYRQAHIYLMPSMYEPFGQSIIEAGVCGLPIVAFSQAANVQTATHEIMGDLAIYAPEVSAKSLAGAIERAHRAFYIERTMSGAVVSKHIASRYSWSRLYELLTSRSE